MSVTQNAQKRFQPAYEMNHPPLHQGKTTVQTLSMGSNFSNNDQSQLQQQQNPIHPKQQPNQKQEKNQEISQPLIQDRQPIIYNNEDDPIARRKLILEINKKAIYQQFIQVIIIFACSCFDDFFTFYESLFYWGSEDNVQPTHMRVISVFIIILVVVLMIIVRFYKELWKKNSKGTLIYVIYFILYTLFSNLLSVGVHYFRIRNRITNNGIYNFFYYFSYYYTEISFAGLIMMLQCHFLLYYSSNQLKLKFFFIPMFYIPLLWYWFFSMVTSVQFLPTIYFTYLTPLWPMLFIIFYVPSLLQIYKGKFKLDNSQSNLGSVLVITNMFFLCVNE